MKRLKSMVAVAGIIAALGMTSTQAFAATAYEAPVNVAATVMEETQTSGTAITSQGKVLVGHHGGGGHSRHSSKTHKSCGRNSGHSYKNCPYY